MADQLPDEKFYRACPHCGGKNTGYWIIGVEETEWFTTIVHTADGFTLDACSEVNRHRCCNLTQH
jgi:hypothetical protein